KPKSATSRLASMGVYLFDRASLIRWLVEDAAREDSTHDFGRDLLPRLVARGEGVFAYRFPDYWQDVGTLDSYYQANMAFLDDRPPLDLVHPEGVVHTQSADRPPVQFEHGAIVERSLIANGCHIAGRVERSVLSPGVRVAAGAVVRDSIIMHDSVISSGAVVDRAILDKNVRVGEAARLGVGPSDIPNRSCPEHLASGLLVVGVGAALPAGLSVGRNARVAAHVAESAFTADVPPGGVVNGPESIH
ncbi:MAG: sugar phosphate nucleotidyltransferase, partial [Candidatus Eiseniibacteriota bacterium]